MQTPRFRLLICDLDNTLYDWYNYFVPSFYAMVDEAVEILRCEKEKLLDDIKEVHIKNHDVEHPYSLLEANLVGIILKGKSLNKQKEILQPAFDVFNRSRSKTLKLFPSVYETLEELNNLGVILIAHTDSRLYQTLYRLRCFELLGFFKHIFCAERKETVLSNHPSKDGWLDKFPMGKVVELQHHQIKPNPEILLEICKDEKIPKSQAIYVGDSIQKDIFMANKANIKAVWAKYCNHPDDSTYEKLVRISHWTPEDVAHEKKLKREARNSAPDYILENSFSEIKDYFF